MPYVKLVCTSFEIFSFSIFAKKKKKWKHLRKLLLCRTLIVFSSSNSISDGSLYSNNFSNSNFIIKVYCE